MKTSENCREGKLSVIIAISFFTRPKIGCNGQKDRKGMEVQENVFITANLVRGRSVDDMKNAVMDVVDRRSNGTNSAQEGLLKSQLNSQTAVLERAGCSTVF